MIALYFLLSALIALAAAFARQRRTVKRLGAAFYLVQLSLVAHIVAEGYGEVSSQFFRFDAAGTLFFALLTIVSAFVFVHSCVYLRDNPIKEYRLYFTLLMLLTTAITGVYFARNIAVTWIFLEATTLCAAGIVYHRRTAQALEATWKYIFVCSVGIATAYLGILLLSSLGDGSLRYEELARSVGGGNPLYLKIAFLLILCGYSCKMEIFPLYTIGVDANFAAPAPASALISTGLVNAGFLAVFRVYRIMEQTEAIGWVRNVLLLTGILSLAVGALFLRRTNNYKRFLSYSTVENMGIAAIGLGIGMAVLLAFPPSPFFVSEVMLFRETIAGGRWWVAGTVLLLLCIVIYSVCYRIVKLCYQPNQDSLHPAPARNALSWAAFSLLAAAMVVGIWQPALLQQLIDQIVSL